MSNLSKAFLYFGQVASRKTAGISGIWIISTLILLIPSGIFWLFYGKIASIQQTLSEIFDIGVENIKQGADFFQSIPPELQSTLLLILALVLMTFVVMTSFIQCGFVGFLASDSSNPGESIRMFFRIGIKNLWRMIVANLVITLVIVFAVVVGFIIGAIVFMIAGLLLFLVVLVVSIYAYIRFAFTPFIVTLDVKNGFNSVLESTTKTGKHTGAIAFIVLPLTFVSQYLAGLVSNVPGLTELIISMFLLAQLGLLMPLYLDSVGSKKKVMANR